MRKTTNLCQDSVPSEVQIRHLPSTSQQYYRLLQLAWCNIQMPLTYQTLTTPTVSTVAHHVAVPTPDPKSNIECGWKSGSRVFTSIKIFRRTAYSGANLDTIYSSELCSLYTTGFQEYNICLRRFITRFWNLDFSASFCSSDSDNKSIPTERNRKQN